MADDMVSLPGLNAAAEENKTKRGRALQWVRPRLVHHAGRRGKGFSMPSQFYRAAAPQATEVIRRRLECALQIARAGHPIGMSTTPEHRQIALLLAVAGADVTFDSDCGIIRIWPRPQRAGRRA